MGDVSIFLQLDQRYLLGICALIAWVTYGCRILHLINFAHGVFMLGVSHVLWSNIHISSLVDRIFAGPTFDRLCGHTSRKGCLPTLTGFC